MNKDITHVDEMALDVLDAKIMEIGYRSVEELELPEQNETDFKDKYGELINNENCVEMLDEAVAMETRLNNNCASPPKKIRKLDSGMMEMGSKIPSAFALKHKLQEN